jgi:ribosomal protein L40E
LSENDLRQAILLIKSGNKTEAQKILKSILETDLSNIHAWVWYVETLPTINQKIRALELCLKYNPGNERVEKGLAVLRNYQGQPSIKHEPYTESRVMTGRVCPHCGANVDAEATICTHCGSDLVTRFTLPRFDLRYRLPTLNSLRNMLNSFVSFFGGIRNIRSWGWLIFVIPALGLCLIGVWLVREPPSSNENRNALAIGDRAKVEAIDIFVQAPSELDTLTKEEVQGLRIESVYRYPELLFSGYEPFSGVFGEIVDGLPWWGVAGKFYYGPGEQSIEGPSNESRYILNPYLLVGAEPCGGFDKNRVSEELIRRPGFPFYCPAQQLSWEPAEPSAEVTYSANCVAQRNYSCFNLIAYNARDLNLNYIYVSYENSTNISKSDPPTEASEIPQYIHQGDSCNYPGDCNIMSPDTPELDNLRVVGLPARAEIWLWKEEPESLETTPDLTYVIRFR